MPGPIIIPELPGHLRGISKKLQVLGFTICKDQGGIWKLTYPEGHYTGMTDVGFYENDLASGLLRVLRAEEEEAGILYRYKQFDQRWKNRVYGTKPGSTTIAAAGCGPTSLSIVLHYLMHNGSDIVDACYDVSPRVSPPQTAKYAESHGRAYDKDGKPAGTAGDPMIKGIKEKWPGYDGTRVTLDEAVSLLQQGKLIIFLCKHCKGWNAAPRIGEGNRWIPQPPPVTYPGHYMVLAGVDGPADNEIFYVVDPGRNEKRAMRFINRGELKANAKGLWWVYGPDEVGDAVSYP